MKGGSFKKLFNSATQNEVLLYLLLVAAVFNLLAYLQNNNMVAVVIFLVIGYATTLYTKNMSVVLLTTIIVTNLLVCMGLLKNLSLQEGLVNEDEDEENDEADEDDEDTSNDAPPKNKKAVPSKNKKASPKKFNIKESVELVAAGSVNDVSDDEPDDAPGSKCSSNQHWDARNSECVSNAVNNENKKTGNKKIPFAKLSDENVPLDGKPSINYKGTVDTAFDQLGQILGKDGLDKMSIDTENLADKQTQLIEAMNKMEPMVQTAKSMMDTLGTLDLGSFDIGKLLGGKSKNNSN